MFRYIFGAFMFVAAATNINAEVIIDGGSGEDLIIIDSGGQLPRGNAAAGVATVDYETLVARAKGNPDMQQHLERMAQMTQMAQSRRDPNMLEMLMREVFGGFRGMQNQGFSKPIPYVLLSSVQNAQNRAQAWSQLIIADLDNDGQITEQELRDTIEVVPEVGAVATAFFSSDANADRVLSADELRAAADSRASLNGGYASGGRAGLPKLFDFDDDGLLTKAEFDRAMIALGLIEQ